MKPTTANVRILREAAENEFGCVRRHNSNGLAGLAYRRMLGRMKEAGWMRDSAHGYDEYYITDEGRAALRSCG